MNFTNISPEELLKSKEINGGFVYDDPASIITEESDLSMSEQKFQTVPEIEKSQVIPQNQQIPKTPVIPAYPTQDAVQNNTQPNSFGKSQAFMNNSSLDLGWKNLPVSILPSAGLFYPEGAKIAIRAAEVKEIKHFSSIDEDDKLSIEEKLINIIDRCSRMEFPGSGLVSYKDLKQEDRFFLIMAIRDLTFIKGENSIMLSTKKKCKQTPDCPFNDGVELRTGVLNSYELDPEIFKYYDINERCFIFVSDGIGKTIPMTVPSIGVTEAITSFITECNKKRIDIDEAFLSIAPFLFKDWRDLSFEKILLAMRESDYWSKEEFSLYFELSEKIKIGTKLEVKLKCPVCGDEEIAADITFPDGIRSLFVISNILRKLLRHKV